MYKKKLTQTNLNFKSSLSEVGSILNMYDLCIIKDLFLQKE